MTIGSSLASARKRPSQARSRAMVDLILETTWKLMAEQGYEALTTNAIAQRAGISIGSLYQYFPNKVAIIDELQRRHHTEVINAMGAAFAQAERTELHGAIRILVRAAIEAHREAPEAHRVLAAVLPASANKASRAAIEAEIETHTLRWLRSRKTEIRPLDMARTAFLIREMVQSVVHAALVRRPGGTFEADALEQDLVHMIERYLVP